MSLSLVKQIFSVTDAILITIIQSFFFFLFFFLFFSLCNTWPSRSGFLHMGVPPLPAS